MPINTSRPAGRQADASAGPPDRLTVDTELVTALYASPLPSSRSGATYNAFSYPTKISPETVAVFIATHTKPGAVVLDVFGGSGTTGLAAMLCDVPTDEMRAMAADTGVEPAWGPRRAIISEIGTLGACVTETLCAPPDPDLFAAAVLSMCAAARAEVGWMYAAQGPDGRGGTVRHIIWSEVLSCPQCARETSYWDAAVRRDPLRLSEGFTCPFCAATPKLDDCRRVVETVEDPGLGIEVQRRKRVPASVYGSTGREKWFRPPTPADQELISKIDSLGHPAGGPIAEIGWGDLHRAGYHTGITHLHHFYTRRNFAVLACLWRLAGGYEGRIRAALRLLILSYNSTHSTLMTRVVVKQGAGDFVLTGSQSGVLYVSGLPVEKNVIEGMVRKGAAFKKAFDAVATSRSTVEVFNESSEHLRIPDSSVDYVFTDPPFGDFIPYAEVNQINELWLGKRTDRSHEVIVSNAQGKSVTEYGRMMGCVFSEVARVMRPSGLATVVFHSARADIWRALVDAYGRAGLSVQATSVLDKLQASFKQTVADVSVKGDPVLLLSKAAGATTEAQDIESVAREIIDRARLLGPEERDERRLYSRFISRCLELGLDVRMDARQFYERTRLGDAVTT